MENFEAQLTRLKKASGAQTDTALARVLGITQGSISGAKKRKTVPATWNQKIAAQFGVSADWLIFGEEAEAQEGTPQAVVQPPRMKGKDLRQYAKIEDIPHAGLRNSFKKAAKAAQAWGQRWNELPDWAKEEMTELYEQVERLESELTATRAELAQARAEASKAKDTALQAKDETLEALRAAVVAKTKELRGDTD